MTDKKGAQASAGKPFKTHHHPAEIVFGLAALLLALFLLTLLGSQIAYVPGLPLTQQPGLWSVVAIAGMLIFGVCELIQYWRRNDHLDRAALAGELARWLRALEFCLWFMGYVFAAPYIGYLPATLLFCVLLTLRVGYRGWRMMTTAGGVAVGTVVVFKSILQVKIPGGVLYELLPDGLRGLMFLYF